MSLIEIKTDPTKTELRWFGILFVLFFALVGAWAWWRVSPRSAYVIWASAGAVAIAFYTVPRARRAIYLGWTYAVFPIGWVVSHLVLVTIYYLVVTPIGVALRLTGYDPMRRRRDPQAKSYWTPHRTGGDTWRYFRQF